MVPAAPQGSQLNPVEHEAVGESLQNVARAVVTEVRKKKSAEGRRDTWDGERSSPGTC